MNKSIRTTGDLVDELLSIIQQQKSTNLFMKIVGYSIFTVSLVWLFAYLFYGIAIFLGLISPQAWWARRIFRFGLSTPDLAHVWAVDWPILIGLGGVIVGLGIAMFAECHGKKGKESEV